MAASDNAVLKESETTDPTLFCTAYKRNRFYMFTRREPESLSLYYSLFLSSYLFLFSNQKHIRIRRIS